MIFSTIGSRILLFHLKLNSCYSIQPNLKQNLEFQTITRNWVSTGSLKYNFQAILG